MADWPEANKVSVNKELLNKMFQIRGLAQLGLAFRKDKSIKVKQPLNAKITFNKDYKFNDQLADLLFEELNLKNSIVTINYDAYLNSDAFNGKIDLSTEITPELQAEGQAREIVRKIQEERKKLGTELDEQISVSLESWPKEFEDYIKQQALVQLLTKGDFEVKRLES